MERSSRGRKARFIAVLVASLPLTLFAFAQTAWADGVPAPSPGSPVTPVTGPLAGPFSMLQPAALAAAVAFTIALCIAVVLTSRREATGRAAESGAKAGPVVSAGAGLATLPQRRQGRRRDHQRQTRARKHAA
jgi:hypothetical protein